jgi:DNA invertase Pin-like site-specific DNA recombinase
VTGIAASTCSSASVPKTLLNSADARAVFSRLSAMSLPPKLRLEGGQRGGVSKRVAIYLPVSISEQTTSNQRRELHAVAKRHGWSVVKVFEDAGISGAKGRKDRPALDALLKCVARREVDRVAAWSDDRLGRSLTDLLDFLRELCAKGVDLFLHPQGLDTSTPSGRAMFQMMGVFAEFERAMIRERVLAGLARAKGQGISLGRVGGCRIATRPGLLPSRLWRQARGATDS